ncbi:hypothetical protein LINPERHAP1_LOCUS27230 [Linum perenne]
MDPFDFKSNSNNFIASSDGTTIQVYEFTEPTIHPSSIRKIHWNQIATVNPEKIITTKDKLSFDGLKFPEDCGTIEGREGLIMLAQHLNELQLLVSSEGYCFQQGSKLGTYSDFGIHYLRLNDLFNWRRHKVNPAPLLMTDDDVWVRSDWKYSDPPKHRKPSPKPSAELEQLVNDKDEELEKLKEEMAEADRENEKDMKKLKKANEELSTNVDELHKQLKKKDDELQLLKKKMDDDEASKTQTIEELQKLNEDLEDAKKAKEEELQKKKKMDDDEASKTQKIEELEKLNEDLEDAKKAKEEELRKLSKSNNVIEVQRKLKKKDVELQLLKKKMDDEDMAKTQRIEELEKLNEDLEEAKKAKEEELQKLIKSKNVAEVEELMKLLEQSEKKSWSILVSTKFVLQSSEAKDKYLTTIRQKVPAGTFSLQSQVSSPFVSKSPMFMDKITLWSVERVKLVDEGSISIAQWPPLPNLVVFTGSGSVEDFDVNDWWYLKTTHPDGGLTMLVYYEGNRSQISNDGRPEESIIPLPFAKDAQVHSYHSKFSLFNMYPFGVRLGFTYRK